MWADRDSYLSLADGTYTHIRPRVQPFSMVGLGWLAYVRTDYRDSANNESHPSFTCKLVRLVSTSPALAVIVLAAISNGVIHSEFRRKVDIYLTPQIFNTNLNGTY